MNKELIERLKDKKYVRAFGLMKNEERECFRKVGYDNCLRYVAKDSWTKSSTHDLFSNITTYAIKPDYQPEPEYVDLEITEEKGLLGVRAGFHCVTLIYEFTHLHCLPSLPNFEGFYLKDSADVEVRPEWVSRHHPNVKAKFRK